MTKTIASRCGKTLFISGPVNGDDSRLALSITVVHAEDIHIR
jgi:hypothetical protein